MKMINNFDEVKPVTGDFSRPSNGGYIIEIVGVKDVQFNPNTNVGDYLKLDYDIVAGEFAGYYTQLHNKIGGEWFSNFARSYKESALGMFRHFINCVQDSNPGFLWKWREQDLIGKRIGAVLQEEEYTKKNGTVGVALKVKEIKTVQQILDGDFKIPETKRLNKANTTVVETPVFQPTDNFDDMPF